MANISDCIYEVRILMDGKTFEVAKSVAMSIINCFTQ